MSEPSNKPAAIAVPHPDLAEKIKNAHRAVASKMKDTVLDAIKVGEMILEAKDKMPHGQFLPWLQTNCDVSERSAQVYMKLAKGKLRISAKTEEMKSAAAADLGEAKKELTVRSALRLLSNKATGTAKTLKPETVIENAAEQLLSGLNSLKQTSDAGAKREAQKIVDRLNNADLLERPALKATG